MKRLIWIVLLVIISLPAQWAVRAQDDGQRPIITVDNAGELQLVADLSDEPVTAAAWNPEGTLIAAAMLNDVALFYIQRPRAEPIRLVGHTGIIRDLAFSASGNWLAAAGDEGLWVYDMADQTAEARPLFAHDGVVNSIAFFPLDDTRLLSGGQDGSVYVWDVVDEETIVGANLEFPITSVAISPEGDELVAGTENGTYNRWDTVAYDWVGSLYYRDPGPLPMIDLTYGPGQDEITYGSTDGKIRTMYIQESRIARKFPADTSPILHIAVGRFGLVLASGSAGPAGKVRLWPSYIGSTYQELPQYPGDVTGLAFSPDGTLLVTSSYDAARGTGDLRVWGVPAGR